MTFFFLDEPQPDLNITVWLPRRTSKSNCLLILCHANTPRVLQNPFIRPLPAVVVRIFVGKHRVKSCKGNPVKRCVYLARSISEILESVYIACVASNSGGECRFKLLEIKTKKKPDAE